MSLRMSIMCYVVWQNSEWIMLDRCLRKFTLKTPSPLVAAMEKPNTTSNRPQQMCWEQTSHIEHHKRLLWCVLTHICAFCKCQMAAHQFLNRDNLVGCNMWGVVIWVSCKPPSLAPCGSKKYWLRWASSSSSFRTASFTIPTRLSRGTGIRLLVK